MQSWTRIAISAVWLGFAGVAAAQGVKLWDLSNLNGQNQTFCRNLVVGSSTQVDGETGKQLTFQAQWASFGQGFDTPLNWSNYTGYGLALKNLESFPVEFGFRLCKDQGLSDRVLTNITIQPGETVRLIMDTRAWLQNSKFMRQPLPILQSYYQHIFSNKPSQMSSVYEWQVYYRGTLPAKVAVTNMYGYEMPDSYTDIIDNFGQVTNRTWTGKLSSMDSLSDMSAVEQADWAAHPGPGEMQGSNALTKYSAGKWRVLKSNNKWYFVTPAGKKFWSLGMTAISATSPTIVGGREGMFENLPSQSGAKGQFYGTAVNGSQSYTTFDFYGANLYDKFGTDFKQKWDDEVHNRMKSWGMNTLGSGSDPDLYATVDSPFVITVDTNGYAKRVPGASDVPDVYGSDFQSWMTNRWKANLQWYAKNPNFMGAFTDVERNWGTRDGSIREKYRIPLAAASGVYPSSAAKNEFVKLLVKRYKTIQAFNAYLGTNYASWTPVYQTPLSFTDEQIALPNVQADLSTYLANFSKIYYYKMKMALYNTGWNRLYLGSRDLLWTTPDEVLKSMQLYVDVASFTYYEDASTIPWNVFGKMTKPMMIAEFSFMARDKNCSAGFVNAGCVVKDQAARAAKARAYLDSCLSTPNCVGVHWFTYIDQPVSGRPDGENYAFGMVDVTDSPQMEMVNMFRSFSGSMYAVRGN